MWQSARRLLVVAITTTLAGLFLTTTSAVAADSTPAPDQLVLSGEALPEPLVVRFADAPRLAGAIHQEVNWLRGRSTSAQLEEDALGPAYVLDIHVDGEARHRFFLYPLSEGGPRIYRPADQPGDRTVREAWYYGRLSMPDTLAAVGADIAGAQPRVPSAGGGGGTADPSVFGSDRGLIETMREGLQLTALIAVCIAAGLAAIALLIRRKV